MGSHTTPRALSKPRRLAAIVSTTRTSAPHLTSSSGQIKTPWTHASLRGAKAHTTRPPRLSPMVEAASSAAKTVATQLPRPLPPPLSIESFQKAPPLPSVGGQDARTCRSDGSRSGTSGVSVVPLRRHDEVVRPVEAKTFSRSAKSAPPQAVPPVPLLGRPTRHPCPRNLSASRTDPECEDGNGSRRPLLGHRRRRQG